MKVVKSYLNKSEFKKKLITKKIHRIDDLIEIALKNNDFSEAERLEVKLTYLESELLKTYTNKEMDNFFFEEDYSA
jgi:N-glycosylase/DNA lyase